MVQQNLGQHLRVGQDGIERRLRNVGERVVRRRKERRFVAACQRIAQAGCINSRGQCRELRVAQDDAAHRLLVAGDQEGLDNDFVAHRHRDIGAIREFVRPDLACILVQHGKEGVGQTGGIDFDLDVGGDPARHRCVADHGTGCSVGVSMDHDPARAARGQTRDIDRIVNHGLIYDEDVRRELGEYGWCNAQYSQQDQHAAEHIGAFWHKRLPICSAAL